MKTIKFFAALIAASVISINANAKNEVNTANVNTEQPTSVHYKYNNVGNNNFKTVYSTDELGRVTSKMIFIMSDDQWVPVGAYSVHYGENENTLTYAGWNKTSKAFNKNATQQHFNAKEFPVVIALPNASK